MKVVAIKDSRTGKYYAGCNKSPAQTLLGAQLYKSKATAENVINKSVNFHLHGGGEPEIVDVVLEEDRNNLER